MTLIEAFDAIAAVEVLAAHHGLTAEMDVRGTRPGRVVRIELRRGAKAVCVVRIPEPQVNQHATSAALTAFLEHEIAAALRGCRADLPS